MSDQIDTGYAEPPEQWIVAHQVQPTGRVSLSAALAATPFEPKLQEAATGSHTPAAAPPLSYDVTTHQEGRAAAAEAKLAAVPWLAIEHICGLGWAGVAPAAGGNAGDHHTGA